MSIVNAEGTTGSGGKWAFPAFGDYQIGDTPQVVYATRETEVWLLVIVSLLLSNLLQI